MPQPCRRPSPAVDLDSALHQRALYTSASVFLTDCPWVVLQAQDQTAAWQAVITSCMDLNRTSMWIMAHLCLRP